MNRANRDRRIHKRPGSWDRRGGRQVRALNPDKGKKIAHGRALWKANAPKKETESTA